MIDNNTKQLAIIIPAYKDTFLSSALDSIANQTCKEFTLYIGDDCSPYNLESIVSEYKEKINIVYKRFESNLGGKDLVAQWERCIAMSNEEPYIWLFSDDDIMEPKCVEEFYNISLENRNKWLIHFNINRINNKGKILKKYEPFPSQMSAKEYLDGKLFFRRNVSFVIEFIFSRELYRKSGGFQNFDLAWGADFITWLKFAGNCNGIKTIEGEECCVLWRESEYNISPDKSKPIVKRKIRSILENMIFVKKWLSLNNYRYSFKYSKFFWGEVKRNRQFLDLDDLDKLSDRYGKMIGHNLWSRLALFYVKFLCR